MVSGPGGLAESRRALYPNEKFRSPNAGEYQHNDVEGALLNAWEKPASAEQTYSDAGCDKGIEP